MTYNAGGGEGGLTDIGLAPGTLYTVKTPAEVGISRAGYAFAGWNTAQDGSGVTYLPGNTILLKHSLVLYAQWTAVPSTYTVTHLPNGGTGSTRTDNVTGGTTYTFRSDTEVGFARAGYTFAGWNTAADGSGTAYQPGDSLTVNSNITVYAQWTAIPPTYTVTYLPNGGTGSTYTDNVTGGTTYTFKSDTEVGFARAGYTFAGWNTAADGSGTAYQPGDSLSVSGDITVYAQWTAIPPTYTVTYLSNGGTGSTYTDNVTGSTTYTFKSSTAVGFMRAGYTFANWNTQADGSGTSYASGATILLSDNITVYAQWQMQN